MSAKSTVTVLGTVTVLLIAGAFVALPAFAQDDGVQVPTPSNDGEANDPYDCGDFENRAQVEAVFEAEENDNSELDTDNDNVPCEEMFPVEETPTNEPTEQPTEEQPTEQPTDQPTEEPTKEQPTDEPTDEQQTDTPADEQTDEPTDKQMDDGEKKDMPEQTDDQPTEEQSDKQTDNEPPC